MMGADQRELQVRSRINRTEQEVTADCGSSPNAPDRRTHLYFIAARQLAVCVAPRTPLADARGYEKAGVPRDACEYHNAVVQ